MSGPRTLAAMLVAALTLCRVAHAQPNDAPTPPRTARAAVERAKNAFEYRDFERVVSLLYPWLHPRRILDRALAVEARRLLGVSMHVLGRTDEAKEEFAELLLLEPLHKLDPFLVPPAVITAFEQVRSSMKPVLDEILRSQGVDPPRRPARSPPTVKIVPVPPLELSLLPLGLPQFVADEPGWGLLWAVLQVGFLTLNLVAFDQGRNQTDDERALWTGLQFTGLVGFFGSWLASGLQGYAQIGALRDRRLSAEATVSHRRFVPEPAGARAGSATAPVFPRVTVGWSF